MTNRTNDPFYTSNSWIDQFSSVWNRSISLKYLDKPKTKGGLYEDSIWKTGERYEILKSTLVNELLDQVIIKYHQKKQDITMKRI